VPYLSCPVCRFSVASSAATPFQNCPRCALRTGIQAAMEPAPPPRRGPRLDLDRFVEAKERLGNRGGRFGDGRLPEVSGPARGAGSA